jgi:hypothetical protein
LNLKHYGPALALALCCIGSAAAGDIPVVNGSFEDPHLVLGDPGVVSFLPYGITRYDAVGWTVHGAAGTFQPVVGMAVNYVPDGSQVGWANNLISPDSYLFQDTGTASTAGMEYVLNVQVGSRLDGYPSNWLVELLDGNTVIGSASGATLVGNGNFDSVTVTGIGTGAGDLGIKLEDTGVYSQTLFDSVSLESRPNPVPEPATISLVVIGAAVLLCRKRRGRAVA